MVKYKLDNAYKTIGEVAKELNLINNKTGKLNTHTIRFWEKEFKQIKPKIFSGKRRYYDQVTIETLKKIRYLLKEKGFTINGVKKFLINESAFKLDETSNKSINTTKSNLKSKLEKISNLVKEIKKLG
tara:strand:- start:501 stop:884 length:384 start_codon:yes stop_codon:yes gene_type:complete